MPDVLTHRACVDHSGDLVIALRVCRNGGRSLAARFPDPLQEQISMHWVVIDELCDVVRETSFAIHQYRCGGHSKKVYENALAHRLRTLGLRVERQLSLAVYDEYGTALGQCYADLFVEGCLIVELKACREIADAHVAQRLGYLKFARIETGLLVNFGAANLYVKKYLMTNGPA